MVDLQTGLGCKSLENYDRPLSEGELALAVCIEEHHST